MRKLRGDQIQTALKIAMNLEQAWSVECRKDEISDIIKTSIRENCIDNIL